MNDVPEIAIVDAITTSQIDEHVENCARCKHADRIGRLCPVGRAWFDTQVNDLVQHIQNETIPIPIRMIREN